MKNGRLLSSSAWEEHAVEFHSGYAPHPEVPSLEVLLQQNVVLLDRSEEGVVAEEAPLDGSVHHPLELVHLELQLFNQSGVARVLGNFWQDLQGS